MVEPTRRSSRQFIAAATLSGLALAALGFALGRSTAEEARQAPVPIATPAPPPPPDLPIVRPPLGRADLIAAAAQAADAFAAGQPLPEAVARIAGRSFEIRLPFGCPGEAQSEDVPLGWQYDAEDRALRVRAQPTLWPVEIWAPQAPSEEADGPAVEAVEGFWIARPWTTSEACPPTGSASPTPPVSTPAEASVQPGEAESTESASPSAPPELDPEQTLGVAQFFGPESSRVGRRDGQPYRAVVRVEPEALNLSQGLRLRLRGTVSNAPNGAPVLCQARGNARPLCLVSVTFDQVAVENPGTDATIATWDVASQIRNGRR